MAKGQQGNGTTRKPPVKRSPVQRIARRRFADAADEFTLAARAARADHPSDALKHAEKARELIREGVALGTSEAASGSEQPAAGVGG